MSLSRSMIARYSSLEVTEWQRLIKVILIDKHFLFLFILFLHQKKTFIIKSLRICLHLSPSSKQRRLPRLFEYLLHVRFVFLHDFAHQLICVLSLFEPQGSLLAGHVRRLLFIVDGLFLFIILKKILFLRRKVLAVSLNFTVPVNIPSPPEQNVPGRGVTGSNKPLTGLNP